MTRLAMDALESLEFLSTSPNRLRLLDALADGDATPDALGERLELPRSTLRRNLAALEERGYVARIPAENRYELTTVGAAVRDALETALARVGRADSLVPFLADFPDDLPESATLAECDVVVSTTDAPFEPVSRVRRALEDASRATGFLPTINPLYVDPLCARADDGVTVEVIAPPTAYEALGAEHADAMAAFEATPEIRLFESTAVPEYALGWLDDELVLGAFDDHRRTQSVLFASEPRIREWARERYEDVRAAASRIC